ncbi:MAG: 5'-methylthioadenosine/adenosylhomocysteine nucleosidase [Muribaculaceae bacterium]|nr:5'-methylthioadenosine/adenosylhomocysteine nucleosidase [Muribaculaceae bacterium]
MKRIAIIVAMQSEFNLVSNILEHAEPREIEGAKALVGELSSKQIILLKSGIGKVNAAMQVTSLIAEMHPDYIINSGVAGGIGEGMHQGDIVVGTEACYHDVWCGEGEWGQVQGYPLKFSANEHLLEAAKSVVKDNSQLVFGLICTGDQFISDLATLQGIKRNFPDGKAVDMESAAIAQVCYAKQVPFMSLRIVSDTPGMEPDNTTQYLDFFAEAPKKTFAVLRQLLEMI